MNKLVLYLVPLAILLSSCSWKPEKEIVTVEKVITPTIAVAQKPKAIKMLDAAIKADQSNPLPYSWKACTIGQSIALGFREDNDQSKADLLDALSKANELNDNDWNALRIIAEAHLTLDDFQQSMVYANKAYNSNPNHPYVLWIYGRILMRFGKVKDGIKILEMGGNAFDAMIAVDLALAVVYPNAGNLGGGGFLVYRDSKGNIGSLDYREKAPLKASKKMFLVNLLK